MKIISITGTKGKTTTTNIIADVLYRLGHHTLHVNTLGHYVNGVQRSTVADSQRVWGIKTPTLVPGRYLGEFLIDSTTQNPVAVLESSFSCYRGGLGYGRHDVGVILNVFDDHIDRRSEIKTRADLAKAKSFIFSKISRNGWAVFNADDEFVCSVLNAISDDSDVKLLPCGRDFTYFDVQKHLENGGVVMRLTNQRIILQSQKSERTLYEFRSDDMTYGGIFEPSMWNLLHACGAVYGCYDGQLPDEFSRLLESYRQHSADGRLVKMENRKGVTIIADYAHERESLLAIAKLGRTLVKNEGRLVGVVRLNHERPDDVIYEFGELAGKLFDDVIVYDKIDGFWRHAKVSGIKRYPQVVGRTSNLVTEGAKKMSGSVQRIIREDEAIAFAARHANPGDAIVVIVNDDVRRSLGFIRKEFDVELADHEPNTQDTPQDV